jgi:hypothetical protein
VTEAYLEIMSLILSKAPTDELPVSCIVSMWARLAEIDLGLRVATQKSITKPAVGHALNSLS